MKSSGSGLEALDHVLARALGGEDDDVDVRPVLEAADETAEFDPVDLGHHPVQDGEAGRGLGLNGLPGLAAVGDDPDLVAPFAQVEVEQGSAGWVVFGKQDVHGASEGGTGGSAPSSASLRRTPSLSGARSRLRVQAAMASSNRSSSA